ncbi:MAG TPA: RdgB/HAM1 family non-canonical purine NTP pyrophosphatase [Rhodothermales bacterium]
MKIVLATGNAGKLRELAALLADLPVDLVSQSDVPGASPVEEDQPTLHGNARKKAWSLHELTGLPSLADDTGLEVDALGGAPGVRSARFAGDGADDAANRALLLNRLADASDRQARFRTVVAFAVDGEVVYFEGTCEGTIGHEERGAGGFGYDALFVPNGYMQTFAEMSDVEKNRISHRGRALQRVRAYLSARLAGGRP